MAEAAADRGLRYIAITDHSKNLAMTNGMDDTRALAHAARVRQVNAELAEEFYSNTGPQWATYNAYLQLTGTDPGAPYLPTVPSSGDVGTYTSDPARLS